MKHFGSSSSTPSMLFWTVVVLSSSGGVIAAELPVCEDDLIAIPQNELQQLLPPSPVWDDSNSLDFIATSESLATDVSRASIVPDSLITPAEASDFAETATYDQVTNFFTELATLYPNNVKVTSLAQVANGQDIWLVVVSSAEESFEPSSMTKPIFYATGGIHPGESSGVNAGMMLARNLVTDPAYVNLLNSINFLFVPVFNVQGYLRQSENGRINQHGPNSSGRRGNFKMQNLNRDFSKLTNTETRAVVSVFNDYDVSFYTDLHSTDGMNYQDDVTWCDNGESGLAPAIHTWLRSELEPALTEFLKQYNHSPGPCYYANDNLDPTAGFYPYLTDGTEYSTNYADHRQIPSYLLEIHSLKPNKQRVLGAYAYLYGIMTVMADKAESLSVAIATDQAARIDPVPIAWDYDQPPPMFNWSIFEYELVTNPTFGVDQMIWTDIPLTIEVENSVRSTPLSPPRRPDFYYIPAVWTEVLETLTAHGIEYEVLTEDVTRDFVNYRIEDFESGGIREGRATGGGTPIPELCPRTYRAGDIRIPTDQLLGTLAVALLEPLGEQSFFFYGFFNSVFNQNEYGENYIMLPLAEFMLDTYPEVAAEWDEYLTSDPDYGESDVVDWFFKKTDFYDHEAFVYPVGIVYSDEVTNSPDFLAEMAACPDPIVIPHDLLLSLLPPSPEWDESQTSSYIVDSDDPFVTPAESSNFNETATYDEVVAFFVDLAGSSDFIQIESLMTWPTGEDLHLVKVSGEQRFTADTMTKPVFFATAGIHPGESSGVNAGMMFIRNLVTDPAYAGILNDINFFFVPVFNVQGYLRQSQSGRINQHGPNTSGRRGNLKNQNLNRDFSKMTNPETRAIVSVMNTYDISFYIDMHSTDGMNYQNDVTWCDNGDAGLSNSIHQWLRGEMEPALSEFLISYNHIPGPCFFANDNLDPTAGFFPYLSEGTEYTTNYADHRHIPAYLLEIHSLKPNKQRVLGAYSFLFGLSTIIAEKSDSLLTAIVEDRAARVDPVPIAWDYDQPAPMFNWEIFEYSVVTNSIFNVPQIIWTDVPTTIEVENSVRSTPYNPPKRPQYYYIPAAWADVIDVLTAHGIPMERLEEDETVVDNVVHYRMEDFAMSGVREGRPTASGTPIPVSCGKPVKYRKNDVRIATDHPLGTLVVSLLEPVGEGSFFFYGFFNSAFAENEYGENYIMIPIAEQMTQDDPILADEWDDYITNVNPDYTESDVVNFFFRRTAFYDIAAYVYPVGIVYPQEETTDEPAAPSSPTSPPVDDVTASPSTTPDDGSGGMIKTTSIICIVMTSFHAIFMSLK